VLDALMDALTVVTLNGSELVAEGPVAAATLTVPGKKTYVPTTGHSDKSFSIEHWYQDLGQSELFTGCKFTEAAISLPPTGMATVQFTVMGQNVRTDDARYYTAPTPANTLPVQASVNGILMANGAPIAIATGMTINISGGYQSNAVIGSNQAPAIFPGRVTVSGQITAYFDGVELRDAFLSEAELSIAMALTCDNSAASEFVSFVMPRVKLGGAGKDDPDTGITQTIPFTALLNGAGGAGTDGEQTTIAIQDSQAL
jgi:hypothetical protein